MSDPLYADRVTTSEQRNRIELSVLRSESSIERTLLRNLLTPSETRTGLRLGRNVRRRWSPSTEKRAANHRADLLNGFKSKNRGDVAAALTAAYVSGYGSDADDSDRLTALTSESNNYAGNLLDYLTQDGAPDVLDIATQTVDDCETAGQSAATLDTIDSSGGNTYNAVASDGACEDCQSIADGGPYDLDDDTGTPPHHRSCKCSIVGAQ